MTRSQPPQIPFHSQESQESPTQGRRFTRARLLTGLLVLALVAGAALFWARAVPALWSVRDPSLPRLPAYGLELSTDAEPQYPRTSTVKVRADSLLTVVLRPAENVVGPSEARAFIVSLVGGDDRWRPWAVHLERAESGAFALRARVRDLPALGPGRWRVAFAVGRSAALPHDLAGLRAGARSDWYLLEGEVDVLEPPPTDFRQ